jgi:hypothetical protein
MGVEREREYLQHAVALASEYFLFRDSGAKFCADEKSREVRVVISGGGCRERSAREVGVVMV